jgi:uncharacterized integral membrane protein
MMAAIFLLLAVADAALLANVALANTNPGSLTVFDRSVTGFTQGQLLLLAAGLGLLLALFVVFARSSSSARRAKRRKLQAARHGLQGRIAGLERENARLHQELQGTRLHQELQGTRRAGALVGARGASSQAP